MVQFCARQFEDVSGQGGGILQRTAAASSVISAVVTHSTGWDKICGVAPLVPAQGQSILRASDGPPAVSCCGCDITPCDWKTPGVDLFRISPQCHPHACWVNTQGGVCWLLPQFLWTSWWGIFSLCFPTAQPCFHSLDHFLQAVCTTLCLSFLSSCHITPTSPEPAWLVSGEGGLSLTLSFLIFSLAGVVGPAPLLPRKIKN